MLAWELLAASGLYASVALRYSLHHDYGMSFAFVCYALANIGFFYAGR